VGKSLLDGVVAMAAVWGAVLLVYDVPQALRVGKMKAHFSMNGKSLAAGMLRLAWLSAPIGVVMALVSLNANVPRYFIERELGLARLGIFAAMAYPVLAGALVIGSLGQAALPRLARHYAAGEKGAFRRLLRKLQAVSLVLGLPWVLLVAVAGKPILTHLYRPEYAAYADVFLWLSVGGLVSNAASVFGYGMTAARYFRAQLPVFAVVTAVTALACAVLVPRWHLVGAAVGMTLSALAQAVGSAGVMAHALREDGGKEAK